MIWLLQKAEFKRSSAIIFIARLQNVAGECRETELGSVFGTDNSLDQCGDVCCGEFIGIASWCSYLTDALGSLRFLQSLSPSREHWGHGRVEKKGHDASECTGAGV